jgi:hypothetical protein
MEEDEYKSTYNELASVRCVFEKALTNNHARCQYSYHFCLADREGYSCKEADACARCTYLLEQLRKKSQFVFKLHSVDDALPHNMEIRVQAGGVRGVAQLVDVAIVDNNGKPMVDDVITVIEKAIDKYGSLDGLPYSEIVQSIEQFQGRRRRDKRKD